jgi:hypothetical protein
VPSRSLAAFEAVFPNVDRAIVDLTARAYDGIAAIAAATSAGLPVLAVGQHDDRAQRQAALSAGAGRVLAYRGVFEDGPRQIAIWLAARQRVESPG